MGNIFSCFATLQDTLRAQEEEIRDLIEDIKYRIDEIETEKADHVDRLKAAVRTNQTQQQNMIAATIKTLTDQVVKLTRTSTQLEEQRGALISASSEISSAEVFVKTTRTLYHVQKRFSPEKMRRVSMIYSKLAQGSDERTEMINSTFEDISEDRVDAAGGSQTVEEIIEIAHESIAQDVDSQLPSTMWNGSMYVEDENDPLAGIVSDFSKR